MKTKICQGLTFIVITWGGIFSQSALAKEGPIQPGQKSSQQSQFLLKTTESQQTKLFVSLTGNDKNNGSINQPFKSIKKALSAAKQLKNKNVSIQIRKGTYYLEETIQLQQKDISAKSINIESYPAEKVVISGGRKLELKWEPNQNGIFKATVPANIKFERLYINGALQQLARYPNYNPNERVFNGTSANALSTEKVNSWKNPAGGYAHFLHEHEWGSFHYLIKGKNDKGKLELVGGWQNNRPSKMHDTYRFVENIREELDNQGEWYLDSESHTLYYYPSKGTDLLRATVEVSHLKNSIELKGSADQPVRNVVLKGLNFMHNERTFMDTKEPLLRSDWTIYRGGAILFEGTENCKIKDCNFTGLGGNAIMLSNYNRKDSISGCYVAHIGASAVCFIGSTKAVRSPLFNYDESLTYDQIDKTPGPLTNDFPKECVVDNNLFHHLGEIEKQATGVEITVASEITVSRNTIYNTPRAGINIGDGCFGGHQIAFNDVFNTVMETGDHGAFNSWGRDRFWHPNREYMDSIVNVHPELILLDAQKQTAIHDNRFRCDHGWDIDLDDGSSNYHIYNNVCLNGGLKLREGFYRIVENNIIVNNSFHPHVWFKNSGDVFKHNIISTKYYPIRVNDWGKNVDFNLFIEPSGLNMAKEIGTDTHSISGDPLFVDSKIANYRVKANSPAFKIGFKNVGMVFGVQKPSLKKIAKQPVITPFVDVNKLTSTSEIVDFLGGKLKAVEGLGDRSAYGLPDEKGVILMEAGKNSLFSKSGLMDKDVIRSAQGKPVTSIQDLLKVYKSEQGGSSITIEIIRNQKTLERELRIK